MKTYMKTNIINLFLVPALIAVLNLIPAGRATAQTITVTSTADSGAGTLRAALASGDTIDATGVSGSINLTSDDGAGFLTGTADQINTDPLLGPLQDNGGPTFTHRCCPAARRSIKATASA